MYAMLGTALAPLVAEPCSALFGACKLGDAQMVDAGGSRRRASPTVVSSAGAALGSRSAMVGVAASAAMAFGARPSTRPPPCRSLAMTAACGLLRRPGERVPLDPRWRSWIPERHRWIPVEKGVFGDPRGLPLRKPVPLDP